MLFLLKVHWSLSFSKKNKKIALFLRFIGTTLTCSSGTDSSIQQSQKHKKYVLLLNWRYTVLPPKRNKKVALFPEIRISCNEEVKFHVLFLCWFFHLAKIKVQKICTFAEVKILSFAPRKEQKFCSFCWKFGDHFRSKKE